MRSRRLYVPVEDFERLPKGLHLVVSMHGFADAGATTELVSSTLLGTLESRLIADFDADLLIDHRSRRPQMRFNEDHLETYEPHTIAMSIVTDDAGRQFLLLTGPEPDWMWERFTSEVAEIAGQLEVASITNILSFGMPVPHTRPLATTVSGNQQDLIDKYSVWKPATDVPASAMHLLEYRLSEHWPFVTFCVLVPHYIGNSGFAGPALKAFESITNATGLVFQTDALRESEREFQQLVTDQVESHEELATLVSALEARYDAFMEGSDVRSPLVDDSGDVPSADDIAADLERFLAMQQGMGDDSQSR